MTAPARGTQHISVEPSTTADAQRLLHELYDDLTVRYGGDDGDPDKPIALARFVAAEGAAPPAGVFLVARNDGVPVGCGGVRPLPGGEPGVGEIKRMYVTPPARRQGVSRALLRALEDHARRIGYARLQLETGTMQPEAIALYESEGWSPIAPYGDYADSPLSRCYAKQL